MTNPVPTPPKRDFSPSTKVVVEQLTPGEVNDRYGISIDLATGHSVTCYARSITLKDNGALMVVNPEEIIEYNSLGESREVDPLKAITMFIAPGKWISAFKVEESDFDSDIDEDGDN